MKTIILFLLAITFCSIAYTQNEVVFPVPQRAPINHDFTANMSNQKNTYGVIAPPANLYFGNYQTKSALSTNTFASVYDMRTNNRMTSVKTQTGNGCWDFASMGSIESSWKTIGLGTFDLGEHNLQQCHRFDPSRSTWGNHFMSSAYYLRRSGPISQAEDILLTCPTYATPVAYVTDVRFLPRDRNTIKQALLDYGGIYTMINWDATKYNATNKTYFYNGASYKENVNHAVVIAGWNDTLTTAGGTGAWIIKNSWGTSWGDNGYFYIAYGDSTILYNNAVWPSRIDYQPLSHIYNYDTLGYIEEWGYGYTNVGYGLVRFVATANHKITKVGSYVVGANSTLKFQIYKNFNTTNTTLSTLLSETPVKTCPYPGYYTYNLDSTVTLNKNDTFYIKVKYDVPGYGYPIPVEDTLWYYSNGVRKHDYSNPFIETNKCWMSSTGSNDSWWHLGANIPDCAIDLCIKAYAESICSDGSLPYTDNITNPTMPQCWDQQNITAQNNWKISATNYAGGNNYEFLRSKDNTNSSSTSRLISAPVNTSGKTSIKLRFKTMYKDHLGWGGSGATLKVQSSSDRINWTDENFSITSGNGDRPAKDTTITILSNLNSPATYFAFTLSGNLYHISYWAIDDVSIYEPNKLLSLKLYPEGLFNSATNQLNKVQDENGNHFAGDTADIITVKLASKQSPYSINNNFQTSIDTSGHIQIELPPSITDSSYIVINHRNHIETWSAAPVSFAADIINYNFSNASSKTYGDNQKQLAPGIYGIYVGDVNQDGFIDITDISDMDNDLTIGTTGYNVYDLNGDGYIDITDLSDIDSNLTSGIYKITP